MDNLSQMFELEGFVPVDLEEEKTAARKKKPAKGQLEIFSLSSDSQGKLPSGGKLVEQSFQAKDEPKKFRADRAAELEIWKRWRDTQDKEAFRLLLNGGEHGDGYRRLINSQARRFMQDNPLPHSAIKAEMVKQFKRGLDTWEPEKSQLNTWLTNSYLKKTSRFVNTYAPIARIPEQRIAATRTYAITKDELEDMLGREPTDFEIAQKLGWDEKKIKLIRTESRASLTMQEGLDESPHGTSSSEAMSLIHYVHPTLDQEARKVLEHTYGLFGKKELEDNNDIAKKLNITPNRVRAIKRRIAKTIEKYRT